MPSYEVIYIVHPDVEESSLSELNERVAGWITDSGGDIEKVNIWGKRQLAYPIQKKNEGFYVFLETKMDATSCLSLENNFNITEPIMRFLIAKAG